MKLSAYGRREWGTATAAALIVMALFFSGGIYCHDTTFFVLGVVTYAVWMFVILFFRDPERAVPPDPDVLVAPADGVVRDVELIRSGEFPELSALFEGRDMLRIGIFLSVFDVHINRAPCRMTVKVRVHKDGCYHDARDIRAGKENESLLLAGVGEAVGRKFPVAVRQVSGAIARRIVCTCEPGALLEKGQRYGMIKFGSRTELFLPASSGIEAAVQVGDRVQGGLTVMARVSKQQE